MFAPLISRLSRHAEFIGNFTTMMSGRAIAAIIALGTMPIVARLFEPADFGVAAVFISLTSMSITFATLRYEQALVLPKDESEARLLLAFAYRVLALWCLLLLVAAGVHELARLEIGAVDILGPWLWLVPLSVLLAGCVEIQESWLTRCKDFATASKALVTGNATTGASRIAAGAAIGSTVSWLVVSYLLGTFSRVLMQQRSTCSVPIMDIVRPHKAISLKRVALQYADFPRLNMPASVVFSLGQNLPVLLFGAMYTPTVVGYYAMAYRLTEVPLSIVANSLRKVFLQKAAEVSSRGDSLRRAFLLTVTGLATVGFLPFLAVAMAGQEVIEWLLGPDWTAAGRYVEVMSFFLFMHWIAAPTGPALIVLRRQGVWLGLQVAMTTLRLSSLAIAYAMDAEALQALKAFILATVLGYCAEIVAVIVATYRSPPSRALPRDAAAAGTAT